MGSKVLQLKWFRDFLTLCTYVMGNGLDTVLHVLHQCSQAHRIEGDESPPLFLPRLLFFRI